MGFDDTQLIVAIGRMRAYVHDEPDPMDGAIDEADAAIHLAAALMMSIARGEHPTADPVEVVDFWLTGARDEIIPPKLPLRPRDPAKRAELMRLLQEGLL